MNEKGKQMKQKLWTKNRKGSLAIAALMLALLLVAALSAPTLADSADVKVMLDGRLLSFGPNTGAPFIDGNHRTQVPMNSVLTAYGARVQWDGQRRVAIAEKDGIRVEAPIGEAYILKDGARIDNDTAAVIKNQRTYLPISAVMKAFGASVDWDPASRTVLIRSGLNSPQEDSGQTEVPMPDTGGGEMKAMWISYLEFLRMPKEEGAFKAAVDRMMDQCVSYGMNAVIVQVRADSDAMYPSKYFPWSKFASGTQGADPGYDPLAYMVEAAHRRNLEFHAWVNPYRVTGYKMGWDEVSSGNPAKVWLSDDTSSNDRWALLHNGFYYYNPSVPEVRELVVNGVKEIVENYDVDGIHFDDYFYPSLNDNDPKLWFDKPEYDQSGAAMSPAAWRRENVNKLVREVYQAVKRENPSLVFGISPAGNVDNLRSSSNHFVDIDKWMSQSGYIDYIMPQLYWGFERKTAAGDIAPYAYGNNLRTWIGLKNKGGVKLYIGLNAANAGTKVPDNNPVSEWLRYDDILKRQVLAGRSSGEVSGYAFFRHDIFNAPAAEKEVANLMTVLK